MIAAVELISGTAVAVVRFGAAPVLAGIGATGSRVMAAWETAELLEPPQMIMRMVPAGTCSPPKWVNQGWFTKVGADGLKTSHWLLTRV